MAMAMRSLVLLLVPALANAAGVKCPANYCLKRKYCLNQDVGENLRDGSKGYKACPNGNAPSAFVCEQHADNGGYLCAGEGGTCTCTGKVKYGNFAQKGGIAAKWSTEKSVATSVTCSSAEFGDPISGTKGCWCTPSSPVATKMTSKAASCEGDVPKCVIIKVHQTWVGLNTTQALDLGYNELAARLIIPGTFKQLLGGTLMNKIISYDNSKMPLAAVMQVGCADANDCMAKIDNWYNNPPLIDTASKTWQVAQKTLIGATLADNAGGSKFNLVGVGGQLTDAVAVGAATKKWTCGVKTTTTTTTITTTTTKTVKDQTTPKPGNTDTGAVGGTTMPPAPDTGKVTSNAQSSTLSLVSASLLLLALVKEVIE